jgi:hypothetical protein
MSNHITEYKEKVLKELGDLSEEKIDEVIDFIGYIKSKDAGIRGDQKRDAFDTKDNVLLSIVGIGESAVPHDLAQDHDNYVYGDL